MLGRLLAAWDARPEPSRGRRDLRPRRGLRRARRGEPRPLRLRHDAARAAGAARRRTARGRGASRSAVSIADLAATLAGLAGAEPLPGSSLMRFASASPAPSTAPLYAETLAPRLDFGWSELRSLAGGPLQVRPRAAAGALRPGGRSWRDAQPRGLDPAGRGAAVSGARRAPWRDGATRESRRGPDPEAAERLRALGYVQGPEGRGSGADPKDRVEVARLIARAVGPFATPQELIAAYTQIARRDPDNPLVNFRLADALLRAGRTREAVAALPQGRGIGPALARSLRRARHRARAAAASSTTRSTCSSRRSLVDAASGQAHFNLGEIARLRGDAAAARSQLRRGPRRSR